MTATVLAIVPVEYPDQSLHLLLNNGSHRATMNDPDVALWVRDAVNAFTGTEPPVNSWTEIPSYESSFGAVIHHGCWLVDGGSAKVWVPGSDASLLAAINAYTS